jgi:small subunit ribosomal protein S6
MNKYEVTVILHNPEKDQLVEKTREILKKHGVNIISEDSWGTKKLAYQIDGYKEGFYFFANAESSPDAVHKVISEFRLTTGILRFLFVKLPETKTA